MFEVPRSFLGENVVPLPVVIAAPPGLLVNDEVQRVLLQFASLSVRAQEQNDPEMGAWIDRVGLLAVAARLRAQDGIDPAVTGLLACSGRTDRSVGPAAGHGTLPRWMGLKGQRDGRNATAKTDRDG